MTEFTELTERAHQVIAEALAAGSRPCITNSFQAEDMVLTHLVRAQRPDVPVLFLETFHHFPQTLVYRDEMSKEWGLDLVILKAAEPQIGLWQTDTKACCDRHKVGPLFAALANYDTWFAGLRRDQSPSRANTQENEPFALSKDKTISRVSPLAAWTTRDVWKYAKDHGIRLMPLYDEGYTSIGCEPCTTPPLDPDNPRSGRWAGQKLECGIHIQVK